MHQLKHDHSVVHVLYSQLLDQGVASDPAVYHTVVIHSAIAMTYLQPVSMYSTPIVQYVQIDIV